MSMKIEKTHINYSQDEHQNLNGVTLYTALPGISKKGLYVNMNEFVNKGYKLEIKFKPNELSDIFNCYRINDDDTAQITLDIPYFESLSNTRIGYKIARYEIEDVSFEFTDESILITKIKFKMPETTKNSFHKKF